MPNILAVRYTDRIPEPASLTRAATTSESRNFNLSRSTTIPSAEPTTIFVSLPPCPDLTSLVNLSIAPAITNLDRRSLAILRTLRARSDDSPFLQPTKLRAILHKGFPPSKNSSSIRRGLA